MASYAQSVIDQVLFQGAQSVNFSNIVREIRSRVEAMVDRPWLVGWDNNNVVTFDLPCMRILLAWSDRPAPGLSGLLTLSAGPSPVAGKVCMRPDFAEMATLLFSDIVADANGTKTVHHDISCTMTAEWVDLLIAALPNMAEDTTTATSRPRVGGWPSFARMDTSLATIEQGTPYRIS